MSEKPMLPKGGEHDSKTETGPVADAEATPDSGQMRTLLRQALQGESEPSTSSVLHAVQRKIRKRSRGKFYGDGWSTSQSRLSYTIVAITMLILLALTYLSMIPTMVSAP